MRLTDHTITTRRQRLLARIHRRYVTTTQMVRIGSVNLEFTRIADPDKVLDEVAAEADRRERVSGRREADEHLHLPYWAELWDSAAGIGQFFQTGAFESCDSRGRKPRASTWAIIKSSINHR